MEPLGGLTSFHQDQLRQFVRFFRAKRDEVARGVEGEFKDASADRLDEDMYSREDVEQLLDGLGTFSQGSVRREVNNLVNMMVLILKQCMEQSEQDGGELEMNFSAVENKALLQMIDEMNLDGIAPEKRSALRASAKGAEPDLAGIGESMRDLREQLDETRDALRREEEEGRKNLNEQARFVQLRDLLKEKNRRLRIVTDRLRRYEPDFGEDDFAEDRS